MFGCALDTSSTETKATVLIRNAAELESYSEGEEARVESAIKAIADTGAKVVVTGQTVGEMALHFLEKYGLMVLKIPSKFELRRFCRATNSTALIKLDPPTADELGFASSCAIEEIGGTRCCVVRQAEAASGVTTVVLRGATENMMDDVERAVDDGVNAFKALARDARLLPAGGAAEIAVAAKLAAVARAEQGLEQYALAKFAQALEVVPRTLAENAGLNATNVVSALYAAHAGGNPRAGVDIESGAVVGADGAACVKDLTQEHLFDLFATKQWAVRLAADAAVTVLRVDTIIMAKQVCGGHARVRISRTGADPLPWRAPYLRLGGPKRLLDPAGTMTDNMRCVNPFILTRSCQRGAHSTVHTRSCQRGAHLPRCHREGGQEGSRLRNVIQEEVIWDSQGAVHGDASQADAQRREEDGPDAGEEEDDGHADGGRPDQLLPLRHGAPGDDQRRVAPHHKHVPPR